MESQQKTVPLTKRTLEQLAVKAGKKASAAAMNTAGYVIKAMDGWIVRQDRSGAVTRISEIKKSSSALKLD
jgi:hypothetical protein